MQSDYKVSIITATYNRGSSISRAVSSIKKQTYKNIELIIVDGASNDNTLEVLRPLLESTDKLHSSLDMGIYDALNKGLDMATGDIIGFLHSDDYYHDKNIIKEIVNTFDRKDVELIYGNVIFFKEGDLNKIARKYTSKNLSIKNLSYGHMPAHPSIFCKKHIYDVIGKFDLSYKIAGDYEFLCRLIKHSNFKIKYLNKDILKMQTGGASKAGLINSILLNKEVHRALLSNGIKTNYFKILSKYPTKLLEYFNNH